MAASNAKQVLGDIKDDILSALAVGMTDLADKAAEHGQSIVGVPIELRPPMFPVRSKKGEPPRRETGELQQSIRASEVEMGENKVSASVSAGARYARELQERYQRPFMRGKGTQPTVEQFIREKGPKMLAEAVNKEFS